MVPRGICLLTLVLALSGVPKGDAQIFLGDDQTPGIFYAPLPEPRDDTSILETTFTLIPVSSGSRFTDLDYDPANEMVYWCSFSLNRISRIQLDGNNEEAVISTISPTQMELDLVHGKIYWTLYNSASISRANLDGSSVEVIHMYSGSVQPYSILVNMVNGNDGYVVWSTRVLDQIVKANLDGSNTEIVKDVFAEGMVTEQCADDTTLLYYYTNRNTLAVRNLDSGEDKTIKVLPFSDYARRLNKYGTKLVWSKGLSDSVIYQYDLRTSEVIVHNGTVRLTDGTTHTVSPQITIVSNAAYDEPVAIQDCPDDIIVTLDDDANSTTASVSWTEPEINSWSSCPKMEFRGPGTNGGNFTLGTIDLSYVASDAAGNTDECQFSVTVRLSSDVTDRPTTTSDPGTGSATTVSSALRTLCIAFLLFSFFVFE